MRVLLVPRWIRRSVLLFLLIGAVTIFAPSLGAWPLAQQPAPTTTPAVGATTTPTTDPVQIITGGSEVFDYGELLRQLGIPLGIVAILAVFGFLALRAIGKENLDTLAKRLNVVAWLFDKADQQRYRRSLDAGSLAYLRWLEGKYGRVQPLGIGATNVDLDLDQVYVPLHAAEQDEIDQYYRRMRGEQREVVSSAAKQPPLFRLLSDAERLPPPEPPRKSRRQAQPGEEPPRPITTNRLLLLGDAGSGKTTTLCYAALRMAQAYRTGKAALLADARQGLGIYLARAPFPIYVRLTLFSKWLPTDVDRLSTDERQDFIGAKPALFLRWLDDEVADLCDAPKGTLSGHVKRGNAFLLLDGLDEAGDQDRRSHLAQIISNLVADYPSNRYLVASRPAGYGKRVQLPGFQVRTLRPLVSREARDLIRKWFLAVDAHLAEAGLQRQQQAQAEEQTALLWGAIERNDRLLDMATNPLLATAMALLQFNNVRLPDQRAKLYDKLVELLLEIWRKKQVDDDAGINRSVPELAAERGRIERLALEMQQQEEQVREISLEQAQAWLAPHYEARLRIDREEAHARVRQLLESLALHSGLIQHRDEGYSFAHYTFQEYLAARALDGLDQRDPGHDAVGFLVQRADLPRWHETLLLAAGHWSSNAHTFDKCERLVRSLLAHQAQAADLLAGDALADIGPSEELTDLRKETAARLHVIAFADPPVCADAPTRHRAATLLDRLDADDRPALDLLHPDYWAAPIPTGPFVMGDDSSIYDDQKPAFVYTIQRPYALARFPVTNRQYLQFLQSLPTTEAERRRPRWWPGSRYPIGEGSQPVTGVSWYDAQAYAAWANDWLHARVVLAADESVQLPTEPEWERAAAYPVTIPADTPAFGRRRYPWGEWAEADQPRGHPPSPANCDGAGINGISAVGIFPYGAAACGAQDLAGNVWEWTGSIYAPYPYDHDNRQETSAESVEKRFAIRGGAWYNRPIDLRAARRSKNLPDGRFDDFGFRLAMHLSV